MKDNQSHKQEPLKHLTPELIEQYVKGVLPPQLKQQIEEFLDQNPFEAKALEGLMSGKVDLQKDLQELENRLSERLNNRKKYNYLLPVAASITLLVISGLVYFYLIPDGVDNSTVALSTEQTEEKSVIPPAVPESISKGQNIPEQDINESLQTETLPKTDIINESEVEEEVAEQIEVNPDIDIDRSDITTNTLVPQFEGKDQELTLESIPSEVDFSNPATDFKVVVGKVKSSSSGRPVAGASIAIKGTGIETTSDENGFFHLEAPVEAESLVSINSGYATREVPITETPQVDIILEHAETPNDRSTDEIRGKAKKTNAPKPESYTTRRSQGNSDLPQAQAPARIQEYLKLNTKYPLSAREHNIQGKVTVSFTVSKYGILEDFEILQKLGFGCDEEAVRVLRDGPVWKPAKINGVPTKSQGRMEIEFP